MNLFGRRGDDALTAFATEQIKAAGGSGAPATAGSASGGSASGASAGTEWAPIATMAEDLFTAVRRACTLGDLDPVAARIATALRTSLNRQQETMAVAGKRRVTRIDQVTAGPFGGQPASAEDRTIIVRYAVSGGLGEVTLGDDLDAALEVLPARTWFEIWRLSRPADAAPVEPAATCRNCGAPGNGLSTCKYCGTSLAQLPTDFAVESIEWLA